jgi:hypothetical protein
MDCRAKAARLGKTRFDVSRVHCTGSCCMPSRAKGGQTQAEVDSPAGLFKGHHVLAVWQWRQHQQQEQRSAGECLPSMQVLKTHLPHYHTLSMSQSHASAFRHAHKQHFSARGSSFQHQRSYITCSKHGHLVQTTTRDIAVRMHCCTLLVLRCLVRLQYMYIYMLYLNINSCSGAGALDRYMPVDLCFLQSHTPPATPFQLQGAGSEVWR